MAFMKQDDENFISNLYFETVNESIDLLTDILEQININNSTHKEELSDVLKASAQNIISKWKNHEKTLRTKVIYDILPNYPDHLLKKSLLLDAMVNILDDIYDEILTKEQRSIYIIELLRILVLFNQEDKFTSYSNEVSNYFNKLLCVAMLENIYKEKIEKSPTFDDVVKYSIECYNSKSMDIDIFIELPLLEMGVDSDRIGELTSLINVYRALYIIFKDVSDLEHDKKNDIKTPIVIISETFSEEKSDYIRSLVDYYDNLSRICNEGVNEKGSSILYNIKKLIESTLKNNEHVFNGPSLTIKA
jgi:hypothetical protein